MSNVNVITNYQNYQPTLEGTSGDDSISSYRDEFGRITTVIGGLGNDTINIISETFEDSGTPAVIEYANGDGKDLVYGYQFGDTVEITDGKVTKAAVSGNDVILTVGKGTITLKDAKGEIITVNDSTGLSNKIYNGKATLNVTYNTTPNTTITGAAKNALIDNEVAAVLINAGNGGNMIHNVSNTYLVDDENEVTDLVTINSGSGKDIIYNAYGPVIINAGAGNDSISGSFYDATINAGKGNDTIRIEDDDFYNFGNVISYANGDGADVIYGYNEIDTIKLTSGKISKAAVSGNDVVLTVGSGSLRIKDGKGRIIHVEGSDGSVTSKAYTGKATFTAIDNYDSSVVSGTNGADYIYNHYRGELSTNEDDEDEEYYDYYYDENYPGSLIESGAGDDYIYNLANKATINAGKGNDFIAGMNSLVRYGNEFITGMDSVIQYAPGDGDDTVSFNYNYYDSLIIDLLDGASITGYEERGKDKIIKIGDGSITFKNYYYGYAIYDGAESIKFKPTFRTSDGAGGYNYSKSIGGKSFNNLTYGMDFSYGYFYDDVDITATDGNDYMEGAPINDAGAGDDYIFFNDFYGGYDPMMDEPIYSNINLGAGDDTIENGWKGGGTINGGSGNDFIYSLGMSLTTVLGGDGNDTIRVKGHCTYIEDKETVDWIESAVASNYLDGGEGNDLIEYTAATYTWNYTSKTGYGLWKNSSDPPFEMGRGVTIVGGKGNDTIRNTFVGVPDNFTDNYYDNYLVGARTDDTYIETVINDNYMETLTRVMIYDRMIQYASGDGDDVIEDYNEGDTIQLTSGELTDVEIKGRDVILKIDDGSITLKDAKGKAINLIDAEEQAIAVDSGEMEFTLVKLTNKDASPYTATSEIGTIDGSKRTAAIRINGNRYANSIVGGSKADTLNGGKGDDTLTGKGGADVFIYNSGHDVITDYTPKQDKIILEIGNANNYSVNGTDAIFIIDEDNSLTVKNAKNKVLTINGINMTIIDEREAIILDSDTSPFDATGTELITLNASKRTKNAIHIIGNEFDNLITGGAKNDTLDGGSESNDTLTGGKGNDIFVYTGGNDVITDYAAGDRISIGTALDDIISVNRDGRNAILTFSDGGTLTLSNIYTLKTVKGVETITKATKITIIDAEGESSSQVYGLPTVTIVDVDSLRSGNTFDASNIINNGTVKTINASGRKKAINIIGNDLGNSIRGGSGADTLIGGANNDTLTGGAGRDVFLASTGSDIITDYTAGQDTLGVMASDIKAAQFSSNGKDVILTVEVATDDGEEEATITLKNSKGKQITTYKADDIDTNAEKISMTQVYGNGASTLIVANGETVDLTNAQYASNYNLIAVLDASKTTKAVNLVGDDRGLILKGGKGADVLTGGVGDDTLIGGAGKDTFTYTGGDDLVTDYAAGDVIKLAEGSLNDVEVIGKNVKLNLNIGSLTLRNAKNINVIIEDAEGTKTAQKYIKSVVVGASPITTAASTSAYVLTSATSPWFAADTNFATTSDGLNEILPATQVDYSTEQVNTFNASNTFNDNLPTTPYQATNPIRKKI